LVFLHDKERIGVEVSVARPSSLDVTIGERGISRFYEDLVRQVSPEDRSGDRSGWSPIAVYSTTSDARGITEYGIA
jgi:hypothetical protein